jgi:hypothetical protein
MAASSRVRNSREVQPRPAYAQHYFARNSHPIPVEGARLIYFDHYHAEELLEHIASNATGRAMIAKLHDSEIVELESQRNQRIMFSQLATRADDLRADGLIDLLQSGGTSRRVSWNDVHPDQPIAIRGTISSLEAVQPSSLGLEVEGKPVQVFVRRDGFLHLNQSYLTARRITALGKVRSVPRRQMIAVAIGISSSI